MGANRRGIFHHLIFHFSSAVAVCCCLSVLSTLFLLPSLFIVSSYPKFGNTGCCEHISNCSKPLRVGHRHTA